MNEPIDSADSPKRTSLAKCERHGLHYDPAKMSGCVICRREAGGALPRPPTGASAAPAGVRAGAAGDSSSYTAPLLVAAGLCLGLGIALFGLHGAVAGYVRTAGGFGGSELPEMSPPQGPQMKEALRELNDLGGMSEASDGDPAHLDAEEAEVGGSGAEPE